MNQLRMAVIGAGNLGRIHARLLAEQKWANLVAVADPGEGARNQLKQAVDVATVADYQTLVGLIDAAVIATPTRTHFEIASDLLERGIHVLIEKPLTDSVADAQELVAIAERSDCVVQVGHVERFNPAFATAVAAIGKPKFIQAQRTSGYTFRSTDIGVVHDLMIHDIDLVNSMLGSRLIDTRAVGFSMFGGHEDMAQARLQFSCGAVANLTASRCSFNSGRTMQIFGTDGFAQIDFTAGTVETVNVPSWMKNRSVDFFSLDEGQRQFVREQLFEGILDRKQVTVEKTNAIVDEHCDFINAIQNRKPCRVSVEHGAAAVSIAQSVLDSLAAHCWSQNNPSMSGPMPQMPAMPRPDQVPAQLLHTAPMRDAA